MTRTYLICYLASVDCYPVSDKSEISGDAQTFRNYINGLTTLVPNEYWINLGSYCRIFYELKVQPPKEHGYDSDYAVYTSFMDK